MFTTFVTALNHPARRRMWITVGSGLLIVLAMIAGFGLGSDSAWAVLMTSAAVLAGADIAARAWQALRIGHVGIELLVSAATAGAVVIGEYWEAAAVTFLFMVGDWLEMRTMRQTRGALKALLDAAPAVATVMRDGRPIEVAAGDVRADEIVLVKAGQRIPVDGEVIEGAAAVNEAAITGEPVPAEKTAGSRVSAGTLTENGLLHVRATGIGADTMLARIVRRVEEAQDERAPAQRMIERFARWYTPAVFALALVSFALSNDVRLALTLLVVGCPGALVISTPVSVVAGIGRAARAGILIKGGQHLESAGRISALAVDKTGTLTEGRPQLAEIVALGTYAPLDVLRWAAIAEGGSDHPLGRPIVEAARRQGGLLALPDTLEEVPGMGLIAHHAGRRIVVGSRRLLARSGIVFDAAAAQALAAMLDRGRTPVLVATDDAVAGIIGLADVPRPGAAEAIARLRRSGVRRIVMLTGDQPQPARAIATAVGIDEVHAGLLPEQKLEHVRRLRAEGFHVAMIGDGINDAPALAAADTSIAMGAVGSDVAIETADIALMTDDLAKIGDALDISRATVRNMRQNLAVAVVTVAGLLAGVFAGHVHMAAGMLIHQLSVLIVIANGMRLLPGRRMSAPRRPRVEVDAEHGGNAGMSAFVGPLRG